MCVCAFECISTHTRFARVCVAVEYMKYLPLLVVSVWCESSLFVTFGDWGEDRHEMSLVSECLVKNERPSFVVLLGDNFYPSGVKSTSDSQFKLFDKFSSISSKFFAILGNHDYGYSESPAAQIAYSGVNSKWFMPSKYYAKTDYDLGGGVSLCMLFLDTHVFEPKQAEWMKSVLSSCRPNSFKLVFGHHPVYSVGLYANSREVARVRETVGPILKKYNVHAYISGHEHQFQAMEVDDIHYLVSGATAQMNRKKSCNKSGFSGKVHYFEDSEPGYVRFKYRDTKLVFEFVAAGSSKVLHTGQIKQGTVVTTSTTSTTTTTTTTTTVSSVVSTNPDNTKQLSTIPKPTKFAPTSNDPTDPTETSIPTENIEEADASSTTPKSGSMRAQDGLLLMLLAVLCL